MSGPETPRLCATCDGPITRNLFPGRLQKEFVYCCPGCFVYKPPKVIRIERRFGGVYRRDIRDILIETTRLFGTLKAQAAHLGVSVPYLYRMVRRYFDVSMAEFVAQYGPVARRRRGASRSDPGVSEVAAPALDYEEDRA